MKFLKMFFAGLLAFVVGSAVMLFLSVVILFGIVGSMTSSEPVTVGEHAILKLDFSEDLIESPSSDPFAGIDFATMTARHQVTLYNALRAIETAKNDPRIQGIYLRPNGGGVATYAILEELREALQEIASQIQNNLEEAQRNNWYMRDENAEHMREGNSQSGKVRNQHVFLRRNCRQALVVRGRRQL